MQALAAGRTSRAAVGAGGDGAGGTAGAGARRERRRIAPSGGLRVLVAEDNEVNQKVVSRMLERLGHQAEVAVNGREAFERARAGTYDVILMDCQMPEMDGWEATARIRAAMAGRRRIPILALTANASDADRQRCLDAGMDAHLSKPLKLERLADALATWGPRAGGEAAGLNFQRPTVQLPRHSQLPTPNRLAGQTGRRGWGLGVGSALGVGPLVRWRVRRPLRPERPGLQPRPRVRDVDAGNPDRLGARQRSP